MWIICFVLILVIITILLYHVFLYLEEGTLFVPIKDYIWIPDQPYQDVIFGQSSRLHGWYFPIKQKIITTRSSPVVLFCHGNTGNISHRKYVVDLCHEMHLSLFLFDYQGYGRSKGRTTLDTLKEDGEAAYLYLRQLGYQPEQIIVWGESLGGIVATHITSKYPCHRLLLMATFADLPSLALESKNPITKAAYPFLYFQGESNIDRIKTTSVPTLIVHSTEDELIPYSHATRLYHSINHPWKSFFTIKGGHGTPQLTPEIVEAMMRFCWQEPHVSPQCLEILSYVASAKTKHGK